MSQSSIIQQLEDVIARFEKNAPESVKIAIKDSITNIKASFDQNKTIQVGDTVPSFKLPDAVGQMVSSIDLLAKGPMLLTFYRGEWCPFCSVALSGLQQHLESFRAKGVTLVAVSPELPNTSLTTVEKHALQFPILSDVHNSYAQELGIVWDMPSTLRPALTAFGVDLQKRNGDDTFQVPVPTTLLVDGKGIVRNAYIDADYRKRLDPAVALKWIDEL